MAIYTLITKTCLSDCKSLNKTNEVLAFAARIRKSQRFDYFERFHPPILKKPMGNFRLLAEEKDSGNDTVIIFRRLVIRGGKEYKDFKKSHYMEIPGAEDSNETTEAALSDYISSRQEPPPPPLPDPNESELGYLHSVLASSPDIYRDYHCCETGMWTERMLEAEFANRAMAFNNAVFETISAGDETIGELRCQNEPQYGILFRHISAWKMVVLLTPFKDTPPYETIRKKYPDIVADTIESMEIIIRTARRAYPHALLLTPDAWIQVQKDKEGNMALSEEEIDVLESARIANGGFPLFINGRAGSGKSTILQYLFAEYIFHSLIGTPKADEGLPVFFACNDELLARCSSGVKSLVTGMFNQTESPSAITHQHLEQNLQELSKKCFKNFHKWLHSQTEQGAFPLSQRFDYGRFKGWWEKTFSKTASARKLYGPEISWHVIRTYIKGSDTEEFLDPDDYEDTALSSGQNSVTNETYKIVFDTVWKRYHEEQKDTSIWDDQDLARYMLSNELILASHPVVFCDEVQDFTRIELEILHRHSLFSRRTIAPFDQPKIPFAFAGDPFQTLNPTGFQWGATRAFFTEKFIKSYPKIRRKDINYQELTYNYRSSAPVVKFCNSLQLFRKVIFNLHEIQPQLPWSEQDNPPSVVHFDRSDHGTLKSLKAQSEIRIIVPCEEGGEAGWAMENGLADYVEFDDAGVPKNVASSSRVKGLEFARVVLFGFGDASPVSLKQALAQLDKSIEGDGAIEPQYFLNRLYVAASRPKKRLFIIDSLDAINNFWSKIFESQEELMMRVNDTESWVNKCGVILRGTDKSWEGDRENPLETAEILRKDAQLRRDPFLYRQAAQYFASASKATLSKECRAEALELEEKFLDAAASWQDLNSLNKSLKAAWKAGRNGDEFITRLAAKHTELKSKIHVRFALHLKESRGLDEGAVLLRDLVDSLADQVFQDEVFTEDTWTEAIVDCLKVLLKRNDQGTALWYACYCRAVELNRKGLRLSADTLGELAYRSEKLPEAYGHWQSVPAEQRSKFEKQFLRAKAASLTYPENLEVYGDLLQRDSSASIADEILTLASANVNTALNSEQHETLLSACITLSRFESAALYLPNVKNEGPIVLLVENLVGTNLSQSKNEILNLSIRKWFEILGEQGRWDDILRICAQKELPDRTKEMSAKKFIALAKWLRNDQVSLQIGLVNLLHESNAFEHARKDQKNQFTNYLRNRFTTDFAWRKQVHPLVVGRALERAGLFKEILPYYEQLAASNLLSEVTRRLAWQRWARTKWLQALREREMNALGRADKAYKEAMEKAESCGFRSPEDIPEFLPSPLPNVEPDLMETKAVPIQARPEPAESQPEPEKQMSNRPTKRATAKKPIVADRDFSRTLPVGALEVRVNPDGTRINITHAETFKQASVHIPRMTISFEGGEIEVDSNLQAILSEWDLILDLSSLAAGKLWLRTSDGLEMTLPVAISDEDSTAK